MLRVSAKITAGTTCLIASLVFLSQSLWSFHPDQAEDEGQVTWVESYETALERAKELGRPLLVAFNNDMNGEVANAYAAETLYPDPKFVALSEHFVCLIASTSNHESKSVERDGETVNVCSRFGQNSCVAHQKCEKAARMALIGKTTNIAPQHIILSPEGEVVERRAYHLSLEELMALMKRVLRGVGVEGLEDGEVIALTPEELKQQKNTIADLFTAAEKETWSFEKKVHIEKTLTLDESLVREHLLNYLQRGGDDDVRVVIMELLAKEGDFTLLDPILRTTRDSSSYVALAAVDALGKLRLPGIDKELKKLLKKFKSGQDHGRVLQAYAACSHNDSKARKLILAKAKSAETVIRGHALVALRHFEVTEETTLVLRKTLFDDVTSIRAAAAWTAGMACHTSCRPALEKMLQREKVAEIRELIEEALQYIDREDSLESCPLEWRINQFVPQGETRR